MRTRIPGLIVAVIGLATVATLAATHATTTPQPAQSVSDGIATYAACASEDGPAPCVWDAYERGNGEGSANYILITNHGDSEHADCTPDYPVGCVYPDGDHFVLVVE